VTRGTHGVMIGPATSFGLGCSRLGSVLSTTADGSEKLLATAYELGVRAFDTADIYGQGDSERALGRYISSLPDALIITKVGKRFPLRMRLLMPAKKLIQGVVSTSPAINRAVRQARGKRLPTCFEPAYLQGAVERSLRRLSLDCLPVLMLHGPTAEEIREGAALDALCRLRDQGKVRAIGVSCEDVAAAQAAVESNDVAAIQVPLSESEPSYLPAIAGAHESQKFVIAREVLGGIKDRDAASIRRALRWAAQQPGVDLALLGTTKIVHLREAVGAQ
jgi:aryl-alcohol dehydrogenase-like predicted oxidoreductase